MQIVFVFWLLSQKCKGGTWFRSAFFFNELGPFRLAEEQRLAAKLGLPWPQVHCRAGGVACQTAMPGKSVACCPGYPNAQGRAATGPRRHCVQDGLPGIPPGCVGLAGSCSGGAARQRRPRSTPRLISCHPSGMALFEASLDCIPKGCGGRVEEGRGYSHNARPRFPSPLIKPDVRISRIRLSDGLHRQAHGVGPR